MSIPENIQVQYNEIKDQIIDMNQEPIIIDGNPTYGKFGHNFYAYVYEVNLIPVKVPVGNMKTYYFVEFKGVNATVANPKEIEEQEYIDHYYLLNQTGRIWIPINDDKKVDNIDDLQDDPEDYYITHLKIRFPKAKIANIEFTNIRTDPEYKTTASCISTSINRTQNIGQVSNIASEPHCDLSYTKTFSNLSGIFLLRFLLLKQLDFHGPLLIGDLARKDGKRVAFFYMKKYNDPKYLLDNGFNMESFCRFSKYQDYGFELDKNREGYKENLLRLIYIKIQCRTADIDDYAELEEKYGSEMGMLFYGFINANYEPYLQTLIEEYGQSYSKQGGNSKKLKTRRHNNNRKKRHYSYKHNKLTQHNPLYGKPEKPPMKCHKGAPA